jgi:hypothetical protein
MARLERLAPLTGLAVVVLTVVAFILIGEDAPDFIDDPQAVADYYAGDTGKLIAGYYLISLAGAFLVWFAGSIRRALRIAEGGDGRLAAISFGGGVLSATMLIAGAMANLAGVFRADEDGAIDPTVAASLNDLSGLFLGIGSAIGAAVMIGAAAVVSLRTSAALPTWLAWLSVPLALLLASPFGFIGLLPYLLWILIVSILLYRGQPGEPRAPATG